MAEVNLTDLIAPSFYDLHQDIKHRSHLFYWLKGGRGSTKSSFISIEIILGMVRDPEANAVVLRKVASTLRDTVFDQYLWAIDALGMSHLWKDSYSPLQLTYLPTGQQIRFKGADKPRKIKSQKFRHGVIKYVHFEEADEFEGEVVLRSIRQSLLRGKSKFPPIVFHSYNPPQSQNNWINQAVIQAALKATDMVHSSNYLAVPPDWLGQTFMVDAEYLKQANPTKYQHEYLGEVTGTGAEVFDNITLRELDKTELLSFERVNHGLDFGFAHDPLAYLNDHYDRKHHRLYIFDEIYEVGLKNRNAVDRIKLLNPMNDMIRGDSAEPRTIAEFNEYGLKVHGAKKGPGSIDHGMKWLQDLNEIIIDPIRCPNAAREFGTYELDRDANGNLKSSYPDHDNHMIDATRYSLEDEIRNIRWLI